VTRLAMGIAGDLELNVTLSLVALKGGC